MADLQAEAAVANLVARPVELWGRRTVFYFAGKPLLVKSQGGSAGGMLMGAVANMAPELFKGIIAEVPFVDIVSTMSMRGRMPA